MNLYKKRWLRMMALGLALAAALGMAALTVQAVTYRKGASGEQVRTIQTKLKRWGYYSGADGVLIYVQNWKVVLKNAAITMLKVIVGMILIALAVFVPIGIVFKILKWSALAAFILACLVAWVIKFAFFDSYIMCQMMAAYMQVAPTTPLAVDLYGTLCTFSSSFKEMYQKGQAAGGPTTAPASTAPTAAAPVRTVPAPAPTPAAPAAPTTEAPAQKPVFCGQCGAKNERGTKFCGSCGAKL